MNRKELAEKFYIEDHAVIYGLLAKYAESMCGEQGRESLVRGTILYAKERGLRMAMRARSDGRELTPNNYIVYGEWSDYKKLGKSEIKSVFPEYRTNSLACGWYNAWEKYGLTEYGKIYCTYIDKNLVKGFNPENELEIDSILSHGGPCCAFHWVGAKFDDMDALKQNRELKASMADRVLRDFLYHTGHILSALCRQYYLDLGLIQGESISRKAMADYRKLFGDEKADLLAAEAQQNFLEV